MGGSDTAYPADRRYSEDDLWVLPEGDTYRIGITDFAQGQLGDIVYVDIPSVGATVVAGEAMGEIESTKTVADLVAPVSGEVVQRNDGLEADLGLVNRAPHADGWLIVVRAAGEGALDGLLTADAYAAARD